MLGFPTMRDELTAYSFCSLIRPGSDCYCLEIPEKHFLAIESNLSGKETMLFVPMNSDTSTRIAYLRPGVPNVFTMGAKTKIGASII